jgi:exonuclease I
MLVEFQQALADVVASPELCRQIRENPALLQERYDLSEREHERIVKMVNDNAMALNCMLYRANRLAPIAMNLHEFCTMLGSRLGPLLSEYSTLYPNTNVHFYLECDRFCRFILDKLREGYELEPDTTAVLQEEHSKVKLGLLASYTVL